jgi:hypothetical protein
MRNSNVLSELSARKWDANHCLSHNEILTIMLFPPKIYRIFKLMIGGLIMKEELVEKLKQESNSIIIIKAG